jgi:hypothetical protein
MSVGKPRRIDREQLERIRDIGQRRAQVRSILSQIMSELRTAFIMLGVDPESEDIDLGTGEIRPLEVEGSVADKLLDINAPIGSAEASKNRN